MDRPSNVLRYLSWRLRLNPYRTVLFTNERSLRYSYRTPLLAILIVLYSRTVDRILVLVRVSSFCITDLDIIAVLVVLLATTVLVYSYTS